MGEAIWGLLTGTAHTGYNSARNGPQEPLQTPRLTTVGGTRIAGHRDKSPDRVDDRNSLLRPSAAAGSHSYDWGLGGATNQQPDLLAFLGFRQPASLRQTVRSALEIRPIRPMRTLRLAPLRSLRHHLYLHPLRIRELRRLGPKRACLAVVVVIEAISPVCVKTSSGC